MKKKATRKTEICKKQAQKTSKFQFKQAQKQATRKSSKKPATPQKKTSSNLQENRKVGNTAASLTTAELRHMHYNIVCDV